MYGLKPARRSVSVFYSYAHTDESLRDALEKFLIVLRRDGLIREWHDRKIGAGQDWRGQIDEHLESADVILLLVSQDFISSDYCYDVEMRRSLERDRAGEALVIPVILRPCDWENTPIAILQALPRGGRPITAYEDRDEALLQVSRAIRDAIIGEGRGDDGGAQFAVTIRNHMAMLKQGRDETGAPSSAPTSDVSHDDKVINPASAVRRLLSGHITRRGLLSTVLAGSGAIGVAALGSLIVRQESLLQQSSATLTIPNKPGESVTTARPTRTSPSVRLEASPTVDAAPVASQSQVSAMRLRGVNVSPELGPRAAPEPAILRGYGINAVRFVSKRGISDDYARRCQDVGIYVLGVLALESNDYVIEHANWIQVGNQPDGDPKLLPTAWPMSEVEYVALWKRYRANYPNRSLICAAMVHNPSWDWKGVAPQLNGVMGIARNLYRAGPPQETRRALDEFRSVRPDVPLWVTEWNLININDILPLSTVMAEVTTIDFFYCWSDWQEADFGLFESDGLTPKQAFLPYIRR